MASARYYPFMAEPCGRCATIAPRKVAVASQKRVVALEAKLSELVQAGDLRRIAGAPPIGMVERRWHDVEASAFVCTKCGRDFWLVVDRGLTRGTLQRGLKRPSQG